jgi:hypothetical protein
MIPRQRRVSLRARTQRLTRLTCDSVAGCSDAYQHDNDNAAKEGAAERDMFRYE